MTSDRRQYRFSMGSAADPCSSVWRIWTQGDEAYVAVRNMIGVAKLSLHSNGYWQFRAGNMVARYRRPAPYRSGWTRGPGILIPHNPLDMRLPYYDALQRDRTDWLEQPAQDSMAQIALQFGPRVREPGSWSPEREKGVSVLTTLKLRTGGALHVFRSDRPITAEESSRIHQIRSVMESKHPTSTEIGPFGLSVVSSQPDVTGLPLLIETQVRPLRRSDVPPFSTDEETSLPAPAV